ncbi:eukaryotic membrane protein family-domain-containing protein [Coniochaeta sp. 2T2.1]|nr:eukaryotic membrane protein family-domain-containing protein [Coniochaeta sp. 2T2.1]
MEQDTRLDKPGAAANSTPHATHLPSPLLTPDLSKSAPNEPSPKHTEEYMPKASLQSASSSDPASENISAEDMSSEPSMSSHERKPVKDEQADTAPKTRSRSGTKSSTGAHDGIRRLSASGIQALTAERESLPVASIPSRQPSDHPLSAGLAETTGRPSMSELLGIVRPDAAEDTDVLRSDGTNPRVLHTGRPNITSRALSTPPTSRRRSSTQHVPSQSVPTRRNSYNPVPKPQPLDLNGRSNVPHPASKAASGGRSEPLDAPLPSPIPPSIPLPPMSIPTLLQLELAQGRPSPLYIHHSYASDQPYESSAVKFERLKNFLLLPPHLERTLSFGALACLDAWLWTFTILPIRFCLAVGVLLRWWAYLIAKEARWVVGFVWYGLGRMWKRNRRGRALSRTGSHEAAKSSASDDSRTRSNPPDATAGKSNGNVTYASGVDMQGTATRRPENGRLHSSSNAGASGSKRPQAKSHHSSAFRHRRTKSTPSTLTSYHKADILQGLVIIFSSIFLMNLDASRMYHFIRAQSAMKLYVIYNVLEVSDRLLSAAGQDIFECLFSSETLSRNSSGRSKVLLPFFMFLLSLAYNTLHAVSLFYQVTTLNVAVNAYSNALLSLLISNQFVEIKSSVFKRFEKENTFQLTCADIVERFQLWIMLFIIGMRNVVEVGGFTVPGAGDGDSTSSKPLHSPFILPDSFTLLPSWLMSGEVLSPFLIVIGSEMLVDWIKHAYINKFNNIKPNFYGRILDILCKDYYTNAFVTPSLTRRLGLPLLPLSCLFIRASVQTYHMFLATHLPSPIPPSPQTSLSIDSVLPSATASSQAVVAALERLDTVIRSALGRAVYGYPYANAENETTTAGVGILTFWRRWNSDDAIAAVTMVVVFLLVFLALLVVKLVLGAALLRYSRDRYAKMKAREHAVATGKAEKEVFDAKGKRVGGFGHVEVGEERRRWVYGDDPEGLRKARERAVKAERGGGGKEEKDLSGVMRYEMIAKRIW